MEDRALTFGEKAVGLTFNPSGDTVVNRIKTLYAEIIDLANDARAQSASEGQRRHWSIAIADAEMGQMRAVKAATWRD